MIRAISLLPLAGVLIGVLAAAGALIPKRRRPERRAVYYALLALASSLWALQVFLTLNWPPDELVDLAPVGSNENLLSSLAIVAMAAAPTYWFLLAADNARIERFTRGWGLAAAHVYGVYTLFVGLTNPAHRLFVTGAAPNGQAIVGPLAYPHYVGVWVLVTAGLVLFVRESWTRGTPQGRRDAVLILGTAAVPFIGGLAANAATIVGVPLPTALLPMLVPVAVAGLGVLVFRTGFAGILPIAAAEAFAEMRDAVIVLDSRGVVMVANASATKAFPRAMPRHDLANAMPVLADALRTSRDGGSCEFEFEEAGRYWWVRLHSMKPSGNRSRGTLLLLTDISDIKKKEHELLLAQQELERRVNERTVELKEANLELVEATRAKDRFLANVSHELRTPLSSIIAFAELLLKGTAGPLHDEQENRIRVILESGRHQRAIIEDLLDLSRIKMGRVEVCPSEFSLLGFVDLIAHMTRPSADERGLRFEVHAPEDDIQLDTDEAKLRQILLNLLTNAVKFTEQGTVSLTVESNHAHRVRFHVKDTGPGIDAEDLSTIMDEFVQIQQADSLSPNGTGLGLAISNRLAVILGGSLSVASHPGQGSTFSLELPVTWAPGVLTNPSSARAPRQ